MNAEDVLKKGQPWKPADATLAIRRLAGGVYTLNLTEHAKAQMATRGLYTPDVMHVLKRGFVYEDSETATRPECFKYKVECVTPNGPRTVRVVAIPWCDPPEIKIVTVMWRDERV
jgi:hypothetical protein